MLRRGDPEGKLAADALLGAEPETDREGAVAIRRRLQEIEEITAETGGSESLEEEKARLLASMKDGCWEKNLKSRLQAEHRNIATQLRIEVRFRVPPRRAVRRTAPAAKKLDWEEVHRASY